jgi:hypothetical protein
LTRTVDLGGNAGDVTLAVRGDLILNTNISLTVRHDLSALAGRRLEGIMVFGVPVPTARASNVCAGEQANGSGRLILCGGNAQRLVADGLVHTSDGMAINSQATVDVIGAMYHGNRATANPSFTNQNATLVVRFDPQAIVGPVNKGISLVSWQQLK